MCFPCFGLTYVSYVILLQQPERLTRLQMRAAQNRTDSITINIFHHYFGISFPVIIKIVLLARPKTDHGIFNARLLFFLLVCKAILPWPLLSFSFVV